MPWVEKDDVLHTLVLGAVPLPVGVHLVHVRHRQIPWAEDVLPLGIEHDAAPVGAPTEDVGAQRDAPALEEWE